MVNRTPSGSAALRNNGRALLMTHRPPRTADMALPNRAFGDLLGWATGRAGRGAETE